MEPRLVLLGLRTYAQGQEGSLLRHDVFLGPVVHGTYIETCVCKISLILFSCSGDACFQPVLV